MMHNGIFESKVHFGTIALKVGSVVHINIRNAFIVNPFNNRIVSILTAESKVV